MASRTWRIFRPPERIPLTVWADTHGVLPSELAEKHGRFRTALTPYMPAIHRALEDPDVPDVVVMKAAQVGWTVGAVIMFALWVADTIGRGIIIMFPRKESAQDHVQEKFNPVVNAMPRLAGKITTSTARKDGNKELFRKFPGGWIKFIGSHSAPGAKSSSAPIVVYEEPDDADTNVAGQGGAIRLLTERTKGFRRVKRVTGGTPTIKGLSAIEHAESLSDQQRFFVPCHHCGEAHVLAWENVHWPEDADIAHEVYGRARPDDAWYECPHCRGRWSYLQKLRNVTRAESAGFGYRPTAPYHGVRGFHISELMSPMPGARFGEMVRKYLEARHKERQGDLGPLVAFWNNQLGLPFEYAGDATNAETLASQAEDYPELIVPWGGLLITAGIDVQADRVAIVLRAWGRGEESWLVYWGEMYCGHDGGSVSDTSDPVWAGLRQFLTTPLKHASGAELRVVSASIDASDGKTSDAVYHFVRTHRGLGILRAIKGASERAGRATDREIYSAPRKVDYKSDTKAAKYGLQVYQVGTNKAKDWLAAHQQLTGAGPGRMHAYADVRGDYWEQVTSEVKAPNRRRGGRKTWQLKTGRRNEAWDCEVYDLHAARAAKVHLLNPSQWDALERAIKQVDISRAAQSNAAAPTQSPQPAQQQPLRSKWMDG
jgi:phage terminase large subunit GpA-like protein